MELAWRECISPLSSARPISDQYIQNIHPPKPTGYNRMRIWCYSQLFSVTTPKEGIAVILYNVIQSGVLALPCI